jgi:hypothetical protein
MEGSGCRSGRNQVGWMDGLLLWAYFQAPKLHSIIRSVSGMGLGLSKAAAPALAALRCPLWWQLQLWGCHFGWSLCPLLDSWSCQCLWGSLPDRAGHAWGQSVCLAGGQRV